MTILNPQWNTLTKIEEDEISEHSNESSSEELSEASEVYSCYSEIIVVKKEEEDDQISKWRLSENDIYAFKDITREECKEF